MDYKWAKKDKKIFKDIEEVTLTTYIRNFYHHPETVVDQENPLRPLKMPTDDEMRESIEYMRKIIKNKIKIHIVTYGVRSRWQKCQGSGFFSVTEQRTARLSEIIKEVNARTGKSFDTDVAFKAALQIRDLLKKNPDLIASAQSNTLDNFKFPFYQHVEDALVDGLQQN